MPTSPLLTVLALHTAVALFGFAGLFGKWLTLPPYAIVLGRTVIAAVVLGLVVAARREPSRFHPGLAANGIVLATHWVAFFEAIQVSSVAIGLLGYATFPLFVLGLERLLLDRRFSREEALIALLVTAGLVALVPALDVQDRTVQGLAWGVLSAFLFALLVVRGRRFAATHSPVAIAYWQNLSAAIALLPFAWIGRQALAEVEGRDLALLAVLGVVCTALAHTLFLSSLRRVTAHSASVVATLEPVYGIALAALLLGETPTARTLIGAVLIIGAALVATTRIR